MPDKAGCRPDFRLYLGVMRRAMKEAGASYFSVGFCLNFDERSSEYLEGLCGRAPESCWRFEPECHCRMLFKVEGGKLVCCALSDSCEGSLVEDRPVSDFSEFSEYAAGFFRIPARVIRRVCYVAGLHGGKEDERWCEMYGSIREFRGWGGEIDGSDLWTWTRNQRRDLSTFVYVRYRIGLGEPVFNEAGFDFAAWAGGSHDSCCRAMVYDLAMPELDAGFDYDAYVESRAWADDAEALRADIARYGLNRGSR
ncbi:MAG: hypothetical protein HUK26_08280 [Duodenibacillus sp.]|nr:hypothetical protein [Duodenibacillus sp.]